MKALITSLLVSLCFVGFAQKRQAQPIKLGEATVQKWVSGAPGGRHGTKYEIKVYICSEKTIEFKNVWIGMVHRPFAVEFYGQETQKKIMHGDSILLSYNRVDGEEPSGGGKRVPFEYKGAALIEYTVDGKARYRVVKSIKEIPALRGM